MIKINAYNLEHSEKRLLAVLVVFVVVLLINVFLPHGQGNFSPLNYLFIPVWLYVFVWHRRIRRIAYREELRQLSLTMKRNDKREHKRYSVEREERVNAAFSVVKDLFLFELRKKRLARVVDISEGGILLLTDTKDIIEGTKAAGLQIKIPEVGKISADGLIVRVSSDLCAIRFINPPKSARDTILKYIFSKEMNVTGQLA